MILVPDHDPGASSTTSDRAEPLARQHADVRARLQRPLRPDRAARAASTSRWSRRRRPGHRVRELFTEGVGTPALVAVQQDASGQALAERARLRQGHRLHARRRASRRPSRKRPRPTSSASRRCSAAASRRSMRGGLRDAGRGRLPARDRVLRVPARAQADRRPHLRGRPVATCATRSPTPPSTATTRAGRQRDRREQTREAMDADPRRHPERRVRAQAGSPRTSRAGRTSPIAASRSARTRSRGGQAAARDDAVS